MTEGPFYIGTHSRLIIDRENVNHFHLQIKGKHGVWDNIQWLHHSNAIWLYDGELPYFLIQKKKKVSCGNMKIRWNIDTGYVHKMPCWEFEIPDEDLHGAEGWELEDIIDDYVQEQMEHHIFPFWSIVEEK